MKIINPFGKSVNDIQPRAGCTCSSGKEDAKSSWGCLGYCGCQCSCSGPSSNSDNKSSNYSIGADTHMF